ncbi:MAG: hypothetical protein NXH72_15260 [Hyphomonadaceae bacterium]|nr:hypothetical protein [Hyphomonadaceae bacterium]
MSVLLSLAFPLMTGAGPMDQALRATEAPDALRAAFTVEMTSRKAKRTFTFDPRAPKAQRWQLVSARGEDSDLDQAAAAWGAEIAPDGRLFPDDLRASLGARVFVDDLGGAWRLKFQHAPSANDDALDVWATQRLQAEAWLEPLHGSFLRIDYTLPRPVRGPKGGRLTKFEQSYLLESEPEWGLTYISQFALEFEAKAPFRTIRQNYKAVITEATFFFASSELEQEFVSAQLSDVSRR